MTDGLLDRILREGAGDSLLDTLADRLTPSDLQSLLLEVYRRQAAQLSPATLLANYERNRFVRPSAASPQALLEQDRLAFSCATPLFEPLELAPVCPLGTNSVIALVDQNKVVTTIRTTEVVSDSTNVLALECALRRRSCLRSADQRGQRVRLCASHRLLRAQHYDQPGLLAHFRLFGLCTAGRDEGSYRFELETLAEQLGVYLRLLAMLRATGYRIREVRVAITDLSNGVRSETVRAGLIGPVRAQFPDVEVDFDPGRVAGRNYYADLCFNIYARDDAGVEHGLADGGFTTWTRQLLSNQKERLLISGIGTERLWSLFGPDGG